VGQGAQDDGVGCIIAWQAARLLQRLDLRPRRTIRVVLYTNEENGLAGGKAYRDQHREELAQIVAAIESDSGNGLADGFRVDLRSPEGTPEDDADAATLLEAERQRAIGLLQVFEPLFEPLGSDQLLPSWSGADVGPMVELGVPGLGLNHDSTKYFEIHHTDADTFDKIIEEDLRINVASMALMAYLLAEMPERLRESGPDAIATH
jgi:carboxypeptidase Q